MMRNVRFFILGISLFCGISQAGQLRDQKFGPEWTFKPRGLEDEAKFPKEPQEKAIKDFLDHAERVCQSENPPCSVDHLNQMVNFRNGFWFKLAKDPDVIEVQAKPHTLEEFAKIRPQIQRILFDGMSSMGLEPHRYEGAGHIHLDFNSLFAGDRKLFRNFMVDLINEHELGEGVLGEVRLDGYGPTVNSRGAQVVEDFKNAVAKFDADPGMTSGDLASLIETEVYLKNQKTDFTGNFTNKFTAVNLSRINKTSYHSSGINVDGGTVELRFPRPEKNAEEYQKLLELFQARIRSLSKIKGQVPVRESFDHQAQATPEQAVARFKAFVEESGLKWDRYKTLLRGDYLAYAENRGAAIPRASTEAVRAGISQAPNCIMNHLVPVPVQP